VNHFEASRIFQIYRGHVFLIKCFFKKQNGKTCSASKEVCRTSLGLLEKKGTTGIPVYMSIYMFLTAATWHREVFEGPGGERRQPRAACVPRTLCLFTGERFSSRLHHLNQGCQTDVHRGPNQHHGHPLKGPETLYKLLEHIVKELSLDLILVYLSVKMLYIRNCL